MTYTSQYQTVLNNVYNTAQYSKMYSKTHGSNPGVTLRMETATASRVSGFAVILPVRHTLYMCVKDMCVRMPAELIRV